MAIQSCEYHIVPRPRNSLKCFQIWEHLQRVFQYQYQSHSHPPTILVVRWSVVTWFTLTRTNQYLTITNQELSHSINTLLD